MTTLKNSDVILLHYGEKDKQIAVYTQDGDKFYATVAEAIEALRSTDDRKQSRDNMSALYDHLVRWLVAHTDEIDRAFLTVRDAALLFVILQKEREIDAELQEALSELDWEIAHDSSFGGIDLNVVGLPQCSETAYRSFLAPTAIAEFKRAG